MPPDPTPFWQSATAPPAPVHAALSDVSTELSASHVIVAAASHACHAT